jgi:putative PIN family toxin of toxin-antitoxin system
VRVLLDTNVLAVGMVEHALGVNSPSALIWQRLQDKKFNLLISAHLLQELELAWGNAWFRNRLTPDRMTRLSSLLRNQADYIDATHEVHGVASHWQDDLVLAAAVSGGADFLVTRTRNFVEWESIRASKFARRPSS